LQETAQLPFSHVGVPFAGAEQSCPQLLQSLIALDVSTQELPHRV
jgi:hypothetical protein